MRLAIGSDHRGFSLKKLVIRILAEKGHSYEDFGCYDTDSVDYPDIAGKVAAAVAGGQYESGILICGSGIGMSIAANKVKGIRAALCHNAFTAHRARRHNNANILCLGAEEGKAMIPAIIDTFLSTEFEGGRHQRRLDKVSGMDGC